MARNASKPIHVIANDGSVDVNKQKVGKGEQARWYSDTGKMSIIYFNKREGSPFADNIFYVPAGGSVSSGPFRKEWPEKKEFRYTVVGTQGNNDPVIIIDN